MNQLRQCHQLICPVCEHAITDERTRESAQLVTLFGAEAYAMCPNCLQLVGDSTFKDRNYRRRVDSWRLQNVARLVAAAEIFRAKHGRWPWS
jgi:hypothetical protein